MLVLTTIVYVIVCCGLQYFTAVILDKIYFNFGMTCKVALFVAMLDTIEDYIW